MAQLRLAVELQPNDTETHQALVACCDQQGDKEGGVRQLLAVGAALPPRHPAVPGPRAGGTTS